MDTFSSPASHAGPRVTIPRRPLTKAARRDVRRHVALAAELNLHSVMLDGETHVCRRITSGVRSLYILGRCLQRRPK